MLISRKPKSTFKPPETEIPISTTCTFLFFWLDNGLGIYLIPWITKISEAESFQLPLNTHMKTLLTAQCWLLCPVPVPGILSTFPFCISNPVYQQPIPTPSSFLTRHIHRLKLITFIGEPKFSRKHWRLRLSWQHNCPHAVFCGPLTQKIK